MRPLTILFATSNPHKLEEARSILDPISVLGLSDIPGGEDLPEPAEDGDTFEQNARIKAVAYSKATGRWCLADDSGLEVDALDGRPGVHSARYAGLGSNREQRDRANNEKLLRELAGVTPERRTARFVCALCLSDPEGIPRAEARGIFEGVIADRPAGDHGFGYDPLLYLPADGLTSAELDPDEKNRRSHRGRAIRRLRPRLIELLSRAD